MRAVEAQDDKTQATGISLSQAQQGQEWNALPFLERLLRTSEYTQSKNLKSSILVAVNSCLVAACYDTNLSRDCVTRLAGVHRKQYFLDLAVFGTILQAPFVLALSNECSPSYSSTQHVTVLDLSPRIPPPPISKLFKTFRDCTEPQCCS